MREKVTSSRSAVPLPIGMKTISECSTNSPSAVNVFKFYPKTAGENGSNPIRLLKCHVRREKGPTRGPWGPSVAGRGAHVSPRGYFSGGQTKKIEVPVEPPEAVSVPQLTFTFW